MSNSVRSTYVICSNVSQLAMLAGAILIPVYVMPGNYWWTGVLSVLVVVDGIGLGKRMDLWEGKV